KQAEAVGSLDLNQRVSRMRLVVHSNARRKFDRRSETAPALTLRFFNQRKKIKILVIERVAQSLLDHFEGTRIGHSMCFGIADAKNAQHDVVSAGKNNRA